MALRHRIGDRIHYPRDGSRTVVGPDLSGNPIVLIMNTDLDMVYHIYRYEKRYPRSVIQSVQRPVRCEDDVNAQMLLTQPSAH